jgi:hypothetical protein
MKKLIEHNIQAQITNESPHIKFQVGYQDNFTDDRYLFESNTNNTKNLNFIIKKNGDKFLEIEMKDRNVDQFLDDFMSKTNDDDFNKEFKKKIYESAKKEIQDFFEFYDQSCIRKGLTLEGEIHRMKKMAGIIPNILK